MAITLPTQQTPRINKIPTNTVQVEQQGQIDTRFADTLRSELKQDYRELSQQEDNIWKSVRAKHRNDVALRKVRAQTEISSLKGTNALEQSDEIANKYVGQMQEDLEKANVPERYRERLQNEVYGKAETDVRITSISKQAQESNKLVDQNLKLDVANSIEDAVAASTNTERFFGDKIPELMLSVEAAADNSFGSGELGRTSKQEMIQRTYDATIVKTIESNAKVGNVASATKIFQGAMQEGQKYNLSTAGIVKAKAALDQAKEAQQDGMALELADQAIAQFDNDAVAQDDYIRANSKTFGVDFYNKAKSVLSTRRAVVKYQRVQESEIQLDKDLALAEELAFAGRPVTQTDLNQIDAKNKDNFMTHYNKVVSKGEKAYDDSAYNELYEAWTQDPDGFRKKDLSSYRNKLRTKDFNFFTDERNKAWRAQHQSQSDELSYKKATQIMDQFFKENPALEDAEPEAKANIRKSILSAYEKIRAQDGLTEYEEQKMLNNALHAQTDQLIETARGESNWFSKDIPPAQYDIELGFSKNSPVAKEAAAANVDYTDAWRQGAIAHLKRRNGKEPSKAQVDAMMNILKSKNDIKGTDPSNWSK